MIRSFRVACLSIATLMATCPGMADELPQTLFAVVDAKPGACPPAVSEFGDPERATCATASGGWKAMKKGFKAFAEDRTGFQPMEAGWSVKQGFAVRHVFHYGEPFRVVFDKSERWLAVLPGHPCFAVEALRAQDVKMPPLDDAITPPKATKPARVEFPERARQAGVGATVALHLIVGRDGAVQDSCVVEVTRQGYGFAEAALAAFEQVSYEPAVEDGQPVRVLVPTSFTWSVGPGS